VEKGSARRKGMAFRAIFERRILRVFVLCLVVGGVAPAAAFGGQEPDPAKASGSPKIVFPETSYDFGTIKMGPDATHVFVFRNEGAGELRLRPPSAS